MEEKKARLQLYQSFRDAYCDHILKALSKHNQAILMTKSYGQYCVNNYKLIKLNDDKNLLEYLDNNCNSQALRYENISINNNTGLVLSCTLGTIDVELMEGLEKDWYDFAISYLKNEVNSEIIADLAYEYAVQYERDGFTNEVYQKFIGLLPAFLENAEDKEEYWNMQDVLIEVENDYQLSGIGTAMKLIKKEIARIWNSQYVRRSKKLLAERATKYDNDFHQRLTYLPIAKKKIGHQLAGHGRLNAALFNLSILNRLTRNLNEYEVDKNDRILQALRKKYDFNDIYDLKHDFLQYLLEKFADYVMLAAIIPLEPHKYQVYLCDFHNKSRCHLSRQTAIEYYFCRQKEVENCKACRVERQLNYYSSYYIEVKFDEHKYGFQISYPLGKTWLPELTQLPQIDNRQALLEWKTKASEEELLWAYSNDLLTEIAEFMDER